MIYNPFDRLVRKSCKDQSHENISFYFRDVKCKLKNAVIGTHATFVVFPYKNQNIAGSWVSRRPCIAAILINWQKK